MQTNLRTLRGLQISQLVIVLLSALGLFLTVFFIVAKEIGLYTNTPLLLLALSAATASALGATLSASTGAAAVAVAFGGAALLTSCLVLWSDYEYIHPPTWVYALDWISLGFAVALTVVSAVLLSLAPAFRDLRRRITNISVVSLADGRDSIYQVRAFQWFAFALELAIIAAFLMYARWGSRENFPEYAALALIVGMSAAAKGAAAASSSPRATLADAILALLGALTTFVLALYYSINSSQRPNWVWIVYWLMFFTLIPATIFSFVQWDRLNAFFRTLTLDPAARPLTA